MTISRAEIQMSLAIAGVSALIGALYTQVVYLSQPDAVGAWWLGSAIGGLIGAFIALFEMVVVGRPNSRIRSLPFLASLTVRVIAHIVIILVSILVVQFIYQRLTGLPIVLIGNGARDALTDIGFSLIVVVIFVVALQMRVFIGGRTLKNLVLGRYYQPQREERIFMIVDLVGSTALAQKLGDVNFHKLLNRVFILLDEPINRFGGEVHSYVGDAVFAVWPVDANPAGNTRVLNALRHMHFSLQEAATAIAKEFGTKPEIRAAIHRGPVVAGETGYRKRQITYLGNTVNLAARIEALTKTGIGVYLASSQFLDQCELPENIEIEPRGKHAVKGSAEEIEISSIWFPSDV